MGKDERGYTALHFACMFFKENEEMIRMLVEAGSDINEKTNEGMMAIHMVELACSVQYLVRAGIDINAVNKRGQTALHLNCLSNEAFVISTLIEEGIDINAKDTNGRTALAYAISYKRD